MSLIKSKDQALKIRLGSDAKLPIAGSFEAIVGLELLIQDIQQLLLTIPGERVNRPEFGCKLRDQIWENIRVAASDGAASIREALENFEPRITVISVGTEVNENTGLITFDIQFFVNQDDTAVSLIFPFRSGTQLSFG
jgi:phage baseplate assembly protein W